MIMGSSKNPKVSKWFMVCFKPIEESLKPGKESQESALHQNILFALSNEKPDPCPENNDGWKSRRRRFPRVLKAIFSNAAPYLTKRKRNRKSGKDSLRSSSNVSSKYEKIFNTRSEKKTKSILSSSSFKESSDSFSSDSSLFSSTLGSSMRSSSSSSSIASMLSNSRTSSDRKQTCTIELKELKPSKPVSLKKKKEGGNFNAEIGLYSMLICLVGLIFWGKAFAVFCTSTCLVLVSFLFKGVALEENDADSIDIDSDEYKKKVIMEGLLERSRTRKL